MKRGLKKIISAFLCGTLLMTGILLENSYNRVYAHRYYRDGVQKYDLTDDNPVQVGDNVYAQLDSDKKLTISGQGDMWENTHMSEVDYGSLSSNINDYHLDSKCPWFGKWRDNISKVVIGEGVTSIGKNAFVVCKSRGMSYKMYHTGLDSICSVNIGPDVKSIGDRAFYEAENLTQIVIPSNVKKIGEYAFDFAGLSEITLNDGLEEIGDYAFEGTKFEKIKIPGTVKKIGPNTFKNTKLSHITLNQGTKVVKSGAFKDVEATIYSKDVALMDGAFGGGSKFLCYKNSTADKYARMHGIEEEFLADDGVEEDISEETDSQLLEQFLDNRNDDWQAVYHIANKTKQLYYVDYGKLSIAKNMNEIYVKKENEKKKEVTRQDETIYGKIFGMTLTNGKDIIYQSGKDVYLWKGAERKIKLMTFAKYSYILLGVYGDDIYFNKDISKGGKNPQKYSLYKYNLQTKRTTKMNINNAYYCSGKYIAFAGKYEENENEASDGLQDFYTISVYDMKSNEIRIVSDRSSGAWAALIDGDNIYYASAETAGLLAFKPKIYEFKINIVRFDLENLRKKILKKKLPDSMQCFIDKNRFVCDGSNKDYLYDIKKNSKSVLK